MYIKLIFFFFSWTSISFRFEMRDQIESQEGTILDTGKSLKMNFTIKNKNEGLQVVQANGNKLLKKRNRPGLK